MNDQDNDKRRGRNAGGGKRFGDARPQGGAGKPSRPGFAGKRTDGGGDKRLFKAGPPRRDGDERTERPRGERPSGGREGFRGADGREGGKPPFRPRRDDADRGPRHDRTRVGRDDPAPARRDERPDRARSATTIDERPRSGTSGATELERIAKVMARAGLCSRREAEEWILGGRVTVNGRPIESPALDVGPKDVILVDNMPLPTRERTRLWLYHKPRGLVTTADDPEGRATVFDNLPGELPRVISVGRLDINTEGLLLLTNDGGLARVLGHPTTGWLRRYRVRVHGETDQAALDGLRDGISLDGVDYEPIVATLDRKKGDNAWLTMDLTEGKNREVKRVLEHLGLQVSRLIRVSFGPFHLGDMAEGTVEEVRTRMLKDQLGPRLMEEAGVDFDAPVFIATDTLSEEPRKKRYLSREGFQERRRKAVLGEDEGLRVERGAVADRKGRQVKVERIRVLRPEPEQTVEEPTRHRRDSRNRPDAGSRPPRQFGERSATGRSFDDRPPRVRDEHPGGGRSQGDRPQGGRGFAKRPDGARPPRRDGEDRPARAFGGRDDRAPRAEGGRNFSKRPDGARSPRRDGDERPARAFGGRDDRAPHAVGGGSFGKRPDGDRPPRRNRDDRPPRAAAGRDDRAPRAEGGRSFGGKPSGFKGRPGGSSGGFKGKPGGSGPRTGGKPRSGGAPRRGG